MTQLRITKKYADDIKVKQLFIPNDVTPIFDDWFIDMVRIRRRKVAMVTHAKTLLTFILPYNHIGGAKAVPECLKVLLLEYLYENDFNDLAEIVEKQFLNDGVVYCKTVNRRILGHMNDFKVCVDCHGYYHNDQFDSIDWDKVAEQINETPLGSVKYKNPRMLAKELFSGTYIK